MSMAQEKPQQFRAKHRSASGEPLVRVDLPVFLTRDQAARALALEYPTVPPRFGLRTAHEGVIRAVEKGYRGTLRAGQVDPEAEEFYRQKLIELRVFPDPALEEGEEGEAGAE